MNQNLINEAICKYLPLWWTVESKEIVKLEFGEETFMVIYEIYQFADKETERLIKTGSSNSYGFTIELLKEHYNFLTEQSLIRVANMAAYSWK